MNLANVLIQQARERPEAPAIIESRRGRPRIVTFAELEERCARAASLLEREDLRAGDTVLVFIPMGAELYEVLIGLFRLGLTAMFLDPGSRREDLETCCDLLPPRALVAVDRAHLLRFKSGALRRIPKKFALGWPVPGAVRWNQEAQSCPLSKTIHSTEASDPALVTFTSGSTGQPKGVVRTHGFLMDQHRILAKHLTLVPGEVDLTTLPIFLLANLASGVTSVIPDADLNAPGQIVGEPVLAQLAQHNVSRTAASPAFLDCLLRGEIQADPRLRSLRKIYTGGAPVFPRLLERLSQAAPQARLEAVYGSTEAEPIAHLAWTDVGSAERKIMATGGGLLAGRPIKDIELKIVEDRWGQTLGAMSQAQFAALTQPTDKAGEIVVTGPHVLTGYLGGRGDGETKFKVEGKVWHRTGDAGRIDDQGRLWLLGRCHAKVTDNRGVLYPLAVECAALEDDHIERAALLQHHGRRLLVLEPRPGAPSRDWRDQFLDQLAWAALDDCRIVPKLPVDRRHNAKIDYPALSRMLRED